MDADQSLLRIEGLVLHFRTTQGDVQAVDGVDFELAQNRAVVLLGESGCGKSSLARATLRLLPRNAGIYGGSVCLRGTDIMQLSEEEFRQNIRWERIAMVPQAAMNALNPVMRVGEQVAEPAAVHLHLSRTEAFTTVCEMFRHVGVPIDFVSRYPFERSGGMRQRVTIAMALVTAPDLIILDEPTSALDVLTRANIFNVLKCLKRELGLSFILITHDIATSSELADDVAVMYAGQIMEFCDAYRFFSEPLHPYSCKLLASMPRLRGSQEPEFIQGRSPRLIDLPAGCRFSNRCKRRFERCAENPPTIVADGRRVRCWLYA